MTPAPEPAAPFWTKAKLEAALASLPELIVIEVPAGYAISSAWFGFGDGDRAEAYVMQGDGAAWTVEDGGDLIRVNMDDPGTQRAIEEAGATEEDFTLIIGPLTAEAIPAAVVQMLALVTRLARDFPEGG